MITNKQISFRYPDLAELAYGSERRGCFENPDEMKAPTSGIDCPDILPVEHEDRDGYHMPEAMENPSPLVSIVYLNYFSAEVKPVRNI